ncbi:hypothetical protein HY024_00080 [Candidatus Curtissbacteria bacterium]|nr:hypothetical protein [Candidatus Curtissbacteria bacterium]
MTKSIVKLLDEAIIPAIALIVGKMIGLFLASVFFKLNFTIEQGGVLKFLPAIHFNDVSGYILAENYSNLAMLCVAALGTIFVIVRAHFFNQSHIHPYVQTKLIHFNIESLIAPSYDLYHQAAIWLTYLWLVVGFLVASTIFGITFFQISAVAFIIAANFSWILALDVQREVEISRLKP